MENEYENLSFFNQNEDVKCSKSDLEIVFVDFLESKQMNWEQLFDGFDELYAITYSSSINFIVKVLDKFEKAEIIFGNKDVMDETLTAIIALQSANTKYISKNKSANKLVELIERGNLNLFVSRDTKSHEKMFILKSKDNRYRVICGSANLSYNAFSSEQRENITCMESKNAYDYYKNIFDDYKVICSDKIEPNVIKKVSQGKVDIAFDLDFEDVPINMTLITENGSFTEPSFDIEDDYQIYADAKNIDKDLKSLMPKTTKTKKATLCNNVIKEVSRKIKKVKSENLKAESKMPNLEINYDERSISFDGNKFDMNSNVEGIKSDLACYFEYMQGFDAFSGDVEKNRLNYFRFAVWCLASPFMPLLRNVAKVNKYDSKQFPVYAILYGESNGGKTDYATLLTKMMCGQNIPVNRNSDFTRTTIDGLKQSCKGLPIIIDDLDRVHYTQNASSIIKYDDWGFKENLTNYPSVIITTNELPSVKQEISKRTYICYIDSYIDKSKGRSNHKKIHDCIDKLTNSFYCEYVKRMFDEVNLMCNEMNKGDEKYLPDIFEASSRIILDIIDEFWDGEKPKYLSKCCYEDYFGNKAVGKNAINKIKKAWKLEPEMFIINKKKNQLVYKLSDDADNWQKLELKYLEQELPPSLNCIRVQNSLTMDLDEAKEFFEIEFKKKNKFFN